MDHSLADINLKELIEKETGEKFNSQNKIKCIFHPDKNPSLSIKFDGNNNKFKFKCFGCGEGGDAIDFIMKYRNMDYIEAREFLGLSVEKTESENQMERIEKYIQWELENRRKGQTLLGIFPFVDHKGNPVYFKAKFQFPDGKKKLSYYHIDGKKVINKRKGEELPYNLHNVKKGIKEDSIIIICEGEKDANIINNTLKSTRYVATSVKGVKDLSVFRNACLYICGDTGKAGEKYIKWIKGQLFNCSAAFKIINLPDIKELGNNKDVSDWLEDGHNRDDLLQAFNRSLDLKNKYELQQDYLGIYKIVSKKIEGIETDKKVYLTNFNIVNAATVKYVNEDAEGVKLVLKTSLGGTFEKDDSVSVFDDVKSFRNFLGSMDLAFKGRIDDLMNLKIWVNKYFALKKLEVYLGTRFVFINNKISLVTHKGAITPNGISTKTKSDGGTVIDILDIECINKEEITELKKYLFEFAPLKISYSIIGTIINNLAIAQAIELGINFHHLLLAGESGGGKSTIMENVIAMILNYPKDDIKSIGLITPFALQKNLSDGNYPILFEEFKPSVMNDYKKTMLSEILRNSYDRHTVDRGNKNLKDNKIFALIRPIILAGEETYFNGEKALNERSCIVYLSKNQRLKKHTEAMEWISNNPNILNKLGRSLIDVVLNTSVEEYKQIRQMEASRIKNLKDRPLNTAINICTGIAILNKLFSNFGLKELEEYHSLVVDNIKTEILDNREDSLSEVEKILKFYDQIIEDNRISDAALKYALYRKDGEVYIRTSEMYNQILNHMKNIGDKKPTLELKDFKKQAKMAGYLLKPSGKLITIDNKPKRFDMYNTERLKKLELNSIVPPDVVEDEWEEGEQQVIYPNKFNKKK